MKKNSILFLLTVGIGLLASCSSTYDASPDVPDKDKIRNPFQGDFTAVVSGIQFTAHTKYVSDEVSNDVRIVSISGIQDSHDKNPLVNKTISLTIPNYEGPRSYYLENDIFASYIVKDTNATWSYNTLRGNDTLSVVTITADDTKWEGTFELILAPVTENAHDTMFISNGTFSIPK